MGLLKFFCICFISYLPYAFTNQACASEGINISENSQITTASIVIPVDKSMRIVQMFSSPRKTITRSFSLNEASVDSSILLTEYNNRGEIVSQYSYGEITKSIIDGSSKQFKTVLEEFFKEFRFGSLYWDENYITVGTILPSNKLEILLTTDDEYEDDGTSVWSDEKVIGDSEVEEASTISVFTSSEFHTNVLF